MDTLTFIFNVYLTIGMAWGTIKVFSILWHKRLDTDDLLDTFLVVWFWLPFVIFLFFSYLYTLLDKFKNYFKK